MTLLLDDRAWDQRRTLLRAPEGASLAALAGSIARDLDVVMARPLVIPAEKALLTRAGGRCPEDGSLLEFDPFEPHQHRCAQCRRMYSGDAHDGFWRYWYHLWLAERAVHAAVLHRLRGDMRHAQLARDILAGYARRYLHYPNLDNTLGPSRVFFSTYLESIWLLQLCIAMDTLEGAGAIPTQERDDVRHLLIAPSRELIALYDEGLSNRQVWNVAALIAASRALGEHEQVQRLVDAPSGVAALIRRGCLADGAWYEGENYHMFAHRGLWYGVTMAARAGAVLPSEVEARFDAGFIAPFLTMLPDATLPSRRDSQYAISLRQPRFAEHCELGIARVGDGRLAGVAAMLYDRDSGAPPGDNGRLRSSGDVERNLPAMQLARADLGWRTLLFARPALPAADAAPPRSVHLDGQGFAIFRRNGGRLYAALDYGATGGGHGHPDRLNLLLMDGDTRWLDDMGTGSYVDRSLHWYRSTLAHNAPLVDGRSQHRVPGVLRAHDERGGAGWVWARVAGVAPGVTIDRALVVMPDYLVDDVRWAAERVVTFDLPNHAPLRVSEPVAWDAAPLPGGDGLEDGFEFVEEAHRIEMAGGAVLRFAGADGERSMHLTLRCDVPWELWRLVAPGPPGKGAHEFHLVRARADAGRITWVWSWAGDVTASFAGDRVLVRRSGGTREAHRRDAGGWNIDLEAGAAHSSINLAGLRVDAGADEERPTVLPDGVAGATTARALDLPLTARLGERDYRRSEASWDEAGRPEADVTVTATPATLEFEAHVVKHKPLVFVTAGQDNPLDNEPAEINGDGVQLYVVSGGRAGGWTIVPVAGSPGARARPVRGWEDFALVDATWAMAEDGYVIRASVALPAGAAEPIAHVGVLVNETAPGRSRRRGQLVLGGAHGEWVYLRGDRVDPAHLLAVRLPGGQLIF